MQHQLIILVLIKCVCEHFKIDMNLPFKELSKEKQDTILYGNKNEEIKHTYIMMMEYNVQDSFILKVWQIIFFRRYKIWYDKSYKRSNV